MRIVFINRYFFPDHSATSQLLADLAFHLASRGLTVAVITSRQRLEYPRSRLPARERIRGVEIHRVAATRFGRAALPGRALDYLSFYLSAAARALALLQPGDTLVAKTDPPLISVVAAWVAALRRARLVNWLQDLFPEVAQALGVRCARGLPGMCLRRLRDASLRRAAANVVLSRAMAERLRGRGVPPARVCVIPNWCDPAVVWPLPHDRNPLRKAWGIDGRFVVGYSGNLGRVHDFEAVLDAAGRLAEVRDVVFVFIGGGALAPWVRQQAERRGLSQLRFYPYQPRHLLAQSLSAMDVHLVTLRPEVEGLVVPSKFYAIGAAGRPCIYLGDRAGDIGQIVGATECGICVGWRDGAGLAAAVLSLYRDPGACARMGRRARQVFEERFCMDRALDRWRAVLGNP